MLRLLLIPLVLAQGAVFHCATTPGLPYDILQLKVGETGSLLGLAITFEQVIADSRCPLSVVCVHAGDAKARFVVRDRTTTRTHDLTLLDPKGRATDTLRNTILSFEGLAPQPFSDKPVDQARYIATVRLAQR